MDTIFVRQIDNLFNKNKVIVVNAKKPEFEDTAKKIEDGLHWFMTNIMKFRDKMQSPLLQAIKIGTGVVKVVNEDKKKTVYKYADAAEELNSEVSKYSVSGVSKKLVKTTKSYYTGPNMYPISREDWIQSSDSTDLRECTMCGFRYYLRVPQVRVKVNQGLFFEKEVDKVLGEGEWMKNKSDQGGQDDYDITKKERARQEGFLLEPVDRMKPVEFWELWTRYDVDGDGEEDDIVVTIHRPTGVIVDAFYQPLYSNFRPFIKFIFYPIEYSRDGEGICQILEALQYEINTLHNQRIDRITEINCPVFFVQVGSGLEGLKRIEPGKVYPVEVDPSMAIKEFKFSDTVYSSFQEEDRLIGMADRAVGISQAVMGQSSSERPVAKETWALLEEANKKFKYGTDNIRAQVKEYAYMLLEFLAQYQPTFHYEVTDVKGQAREETVDFPAEDIREIFELELATSSEILNQQVRREINLQLYQLVSDYMTQLGTMAQMLTSPQVPSQMKEIILAANDVSVKVLTRIIEDFPTIPRGDPVVLDLRKATDANKAVMMSADLIAQRQVPGSANAGEVNPGGPEGQEPGSSGNQGQQAAPPQGPAGVPPGQGAEAPPLQQGQPAPFQ